MAMKDTSKTVFNFLKECDGDNVTLNDIATALQQGKNAAMAVNSLVLRQSLGSEASNKQSW